MTTPEQAERTREPETALGNLPLQITALVGRETALEELRSLVWDTRLLTLSGPGGVGKSRLALALAGTISADFVGGAWWADLGDVSDPDRVAQAVAAAVLPGEQVNDPVASVARQLSPSAVLVLDNCEQVLAGAARLALDVLARAPALRVIATSRQSLGIPGEHVWRVPGLTIGTDEPDGGAAMALFMQRAREAGGAFVADAAAAPTAVAEICALLDGLPLAIELAAARLAVLSVVQIAERLRQDTSLLRHTNRAAPGRHRTLQDTLEWSHQLLSPAEKCLFRRLGVFQGNFSLRAAEQVCADEQLPGQEILDLLTLLIDQSLVQVVESPSLPRYRLLGTLRRYAASKLQESGELTDTTARWADHYHAVGQWARSGLAGPEQVAWVEGLELDHQNLNAALRWLFQQAPERAADLACALWPFYYQRGYYDEARGWYERALGDEDQLPRLVRIETLLRAAEVSFLQCDYRVASGHLHRVLSLIDAGDGERELRADRRAEAFARQRLGAIAREQGRYEEARVLHEQSMAIWEELDDRDGVARSLNYLGFVGWLSCAYDAAEFVCNRALSQFRRAGNQRDAALTLVSLGATALYRGEYERAAERLGEALAISRRLGFEEGLAWSLNELAVLARRRRQGSGEPEAMLRDALLVHQQLGDRWRMASVIEEIAGAVLARRDGALAVSLLSCAEELRERIGAPVPPAEAPDRDAALGRLRRQLTPAVFASAWEQGQRRPLEQAVTVALEALTELGDAGEVAGGGSAPILTPRELAVLELLSQGQTNREIAAALYISPSTAGVHVSNILRKLRAKRRVEAAGRAHALGLLSTS